MTWTSLHARLHQVLRSRQLLQPEQRLLVAVSGGQDSLCLIRLLLDLQPKWDWTVAIAHCNHRWRTDSDANAAYVERLAQTWGVPYYGLMVAVDQKDNIGTEAGARTWRYQVLRETAIAHNYDAIATGHTASDRAETVLYNLMRGSGSDGLQSLTWQRVLPTPTSTASPPQSSTIPLIRPLLFMTREETGAFCQDFNLQPWIDSTNDDWHYARNRIRQDLLPYLQHHFNPKVEQHLAQTAEILQAEVAYLDTETSKLWSQVIDSAIEWPESNQPTSMVPTPQSPNDSIPLKLNRTRLATAPLALQRRVLRLCLLQRLSKAPNFEHIEKLVALVNAPNRSQTDPFPGGAIARVDGDWIVIDSLAKVDNHRLGG